MADKKIYLIAFAIILTILIAGKPVYIALKSIILSILSLG